MNKLLNKLKKDLENVDNNYDYYDSSDATRKMKELEKRIIERQMSIVRVFDREIKRVESRSIISGDIQ